ncbi:MAG: hypothetical protein Q4D98_05710 [Planctomycetia bacterium]|nr:hypothetical protein [Planctomycetia bacterium]
MDDIIIQQDGFSINFGNARAFVFDEKDKNSDHFHGMPMKSVDIIVEMGNCDFYIELKDYSSPERKNESEPKDFRKYLKETLKYKFRDTFLYRYAEGRIPQEIHYICLVEADHAMAQHMTQELKTELPLGKGPRWKQPLASSCFVINLRTWNRQFPEWPAKKTP